jgi:hypothetical protein
VNCVQRVKTGSGYALMVGDVVVARIAPRVVPWSGRRECWVGYVHSGPASLEPTAEVDAAHTLDECQRLLERHSSVVLRARAAFGGGS